MCVIITDYPWWKGPYTVIMVLGWHTEFLMTLDDSYMYSPLPITQTFLGNEKHLELLGVQVIKSLK